MSARFLALRWSSDCGQRSPPDVDPGSTFRERGVSPGAELLESRVNEVRDVIARVATHPRRLAGDQRMLVGESDSYAGAIGQPDRDARIVAVAIASWRARDE